LLDGGVGATGNLVTYSAGEVNGPAFAVLVIRSDGVLFAVSVPLRYVVLCEVASVSEVVHWLMHREPRCLHILQRTSDGDAKIHLTFLRLHSRQLCVPFLTFLCFAEFWASILAQAFSSGACTAETFSVVLVACRRYGYHGKVCRTLHVVSCSHLARGLSCSPWCDKKAKGPLNRSVAGEAPNDRPKCSGEERRNVHVFAYGCSHFNERHPRGKHSHFRSGLEQYYHTRI